MHFIYISLISCSILAGIFFGYAYAYETVVEGVRYSIHKEIENAVKSNRTFTLKGSNIHLVPRKDRRINIYLKEPK